MSMQLTSVSVIIPVYNVKPYLAQCLDTVCNQTLKDIEIICVDDGSTDGSSDILSEYAAKDTRIKIIAQENKGAGAARNAGLAVAQGEYLSFLDADDFFEPTMLEEAYHAVKAQDADIAVFQCNVFNQDTGVYEDCPRAFQNQHVPEGDVFDPLASDARDVLFQMFNGWAWDKLFRREFVLGKGLQFQELRTTNDMYFVFVALANANRVAVCRQVLAHQRINIRSSLSMTRTRSYDCFYAALCAMQEGLKQTGVYAKVEKSFVNWVLEFSFWNMYTTGEEGFRWIYNQLKDEGFEKLDVVKYDASDYYNQSEYIKYQRISTMTQERFREFEEAEKQLHETQAQLREMQMNLRETQAQLADSTEKNKKLRKEIKRVKRSKSYRIGRYITYIPRKIRGLITGNR